MDEVLLARLTAAAIILLIGFPVHEFSHALVAARLGDHTARFLGRISLDPRRHFDPLGGMLLLISALATGLVIGWAKPTPVNPFNLQGGRRGEAVVAAAGPLSNLLMAALGAVFIRLVTIVPGAFASVQGGGLVAFFYEVLFQFALLNSILFIVNLIPIPPLDGWKVLTGLLDARTAYQLRVVEQYAIFLIIGFLFLGGRVIVPLAYGVFGLLSGISV